MQNFQIVSGYYDQYQTTGMKLGWPQGFPRVGRTETFRYRTHGHPLHKSLQNRELFYVQAAFLCLFTSAK